MNLAETPLDQIGSAADGHYRAAEKAAGKAEEHYRSAGIYLKHAKLRVLKTRGLTWERWLKDHCPISRSRADEVIAISDGRQTVEEAKQRHTDRHAREREEREAGKAAMAERSADRPEKPNVFNEGPSKQQSFDPVKEAEDIQAKAHESRLRVIKNRLNGATEDQLKQIEDILNV